MNHPEAVALILAAGESRRMGSPKALLPLGEETVLVRSVNLFLNAGIRNILVVIGCKGKTIQSHHSNLPVQWVQNNQFEKGMFSSVVKGVEAIPPDHSCFFVLPVDIPMVRPPTIFNLLEAYPALKKDTSILYPTVMGKRGHPPLISTRLIPGICAWNGVGGLGGFLSGHDADAREIPVIDEFIGRDMDTPADYEALKAAFSRYHIPTSLECEAMMADTSFFSEKTASHCLQVARLALYFGTTLAACNAPLDIERITAGALLHDISKGEKSHASAGAALLRKMDFSGISDIVSAHMDIDPPKALPVTEAEVVYLADKLIEGDRLVPLSVRFERKLAKYGNDPSARAVILKRRTDAEVIVKRMEHATGISFQAIMEGFSQDIQ
jgi:putative nucleotidyltransferase with HDIG domain